MDAWLDNHVKGLLARPCLDVAARVAARLNNRRGGQNIDERAITEDFLDWFSTDSSLSVWESTLSLLRDEGIHFDGRVSKSTREYETGADIGILVHRETYSEVPTVATYACLVQAKKINNEGKIRGFFHEVGKEKYRQCSLLLDITPSSFYFVYVPTQLLLEDLSAAIREIGDSETRKELDRFLDALSNWTDAAGILVIPALAVEAQQYKSKDLGIKDLLPNCIPFWYWFTELLMPAFIGDRSEKAVVAATNSQDEVDLPLDGFGVQNVLKITIGNR